MKFKQQGVALAVMAALMSQAAFAVTSSNAVGKVSGRQIQMSGVATLATPGLVGTNVTATVPSTNDADGDVLSDWLYQWKVDGVAVGTEASAGSASAIPPYTIRLGDEGKQIDLCLKAVADKGYPVATKTSTEGCVVAGGGTAPIVQPSVVDITAPGAQSVQEGDAYSLTLAATSSSPSPVYSWTIEGGADAALFTIDAGTGQLTMAAKNFEAPADVGADNTYEVTVKVTDSVNGASSTENLVVTVTDVGEALVSSITDVTDNAIADGVATNGASLLLLDDAGNPVIGQTVSISTSKGVLSRTSGTTDSSGKLSVTLTNTLAEAATITFSWTGPDGQPVTATQAVTFTLGGINVVNVTDQSGGVIGADPLVGTVLYAAVQLHGEASASTGRGAEDIGGGQVLTYQWESSADGTTWNTVSGATGDSYTTTRNDQGYSFRVDVTAN